MSGDRVVRGRPIEILLVEDDPVDVRLTTQQLADSKVRNTVSVVGDGAEALAFLRREPPFEDVPRPDVILLDLNMPVMDGHQFLEVIKQDPVLVLIPVVVVTTSDEDEDIIRSYQLHANAFVTKPIGLDEFGKVVRAIEDFWFEVVRLPHDDR